MFAQEAVHREKVGVNVITIPIKHILLYLHVCVAVNFCTVNYWIIDVCLCIKVNNTHNTM